MLAESTKPEFRLPAIRVESGKAAEIRPKRVQSWLDALPLTDSMEAGQKLYQALYALNRVSLDTDNRYALIDLYRQPVIAVSEVLVGTFSSLPLPLGGKAKQSSDLVVDLERELAIAHKRLVTDILENQRHPEREKNLPLILVNTITHIGRQMLSCFQVYRSHRSGLWRELNKLYAYAEQIGCENTPIEGTGIQRGSVTVTKAYVRVLLLGLSNPFGLFQGDCVRIYKYLMGQPIRATLTRNVTVEDPNGLFLINLDVDSCPAPFPRMPKFEDSHNLRVLDAALVAQDVRALRIDLEEGDVPDSLKKVTDFIDNSFMDLLRRMSRFWGIVIRRQTTRNARRDPVSVCVGIKGAHYILSGEKPFASPSMSTQDSDGQGVQDQDLTKPAEAGIAVQSVAQDPSQEQDTAVVNSGYIDLDELVVAEQLMVEQENSRDIFSAETWHDLGAYQTYHWHIKDESAGGFALAHAGETHAKIRVGDLLLLRNEPEDRWRVGVIRWMKCVPQSQKIEMGVQLLSPVVQPVAVSTLAAEEADEDGETELHFVPALLLPANRALGQPTSLIVPRGIHQANGQLLLANGELVPSAVQASEVIERTGSFEQIAIAETDIR
ncbi:MAG: hypothetical protein GXP09_10530 [Gammaproteobacteria bacterium]|nr:hypothetical protein [Gammaproteobacteria bacterium]